MAGIESSYDRYLRGNNGASRVQVDALGKPHGELTTREPVPGRQLRLTLDLEVQKTGQQALGGAKGAFVVMDIKTGAVRALGSSPVVQPQRLLQADPAEGLQAPDRQANGAPLSNRAMQGLYPAGSTSSSSPRWRASTAD